MRILIDETSVGRVKHPIRPEFINTHEHFWDAFGSNETEISATWIVRLCVQLGGWIAFTEEQIEALYSSKGYHNFSFNRLLDREYGVVLGVDGKYRVTHHFICRCFAASPAISLPSELPEHFVPELLSGGPRPSEQL